MLHKYLKSKTTLLRLREGAAWALVIINLVTNYYADPTVLRHDEEVGCQQRETLKASGEIKQN